MFSSAGQLPSSSQMTSCNGDVWVLLTDAIGDNAQCLALAEELGVPVIRMRVDRRAPDQAYDRSTSKGLLADTPKAENNRRALGLHAPWPKLIIGGGKRADRIGLWVKAQSAGWTKYIGIGRAHKPLAQYDLLVAPPQYALPSRPNIIRLRLPLARRRSNSKTVAPIVEDTRRKLGDLVPVRKPWFTILLGGEAKEFITSERELACAAQRAQAAADRHGGTVIVSSSRRTPEKILATVEAVLARRTYVYRWSSSGANRNPYRALLEQSSALFVTADSASMIVEACSSGTPTYVIEYPARFDLRRRWRSYMFSFTRVSTAFCRGHGWRQAAQLLDLVQEWLHNNGVLQYPRDLKKLHARLYDMALARPVTVFDPATLQPRKDEGCDLTRPSDLRHLVGRCRALLQTDDVTSGVVRHHDSSEGSF